jgi:serine/threonine protein kinase
MFDYRLNIDKNKNLINYSECRKLIDAHCFDKIGSGGQAEVFKAVSEKCGSVIIKKSGKAKYNEKENNKKFQALIWENKFMLKIRNLINDNICPNFIKVIDFIPEKKYLILEYADGDCSKLFQKEFKFDILWSFLCQSLIGLLSLHKILKVFHRDLHFGNVLYKKINENIVFSYEINGKQYLVPTFGYLFMISDFGKSAEIDYIEKTEKKHYINASTVRDIEIFSLAFDKTIIKSISKAHNETFSEFKKIFTVGNQQVIQKMINSDISIRDIILKTDYFKKITFPIFNNGELIKSGFDKKIIELKNMLKSNISLVELIDEIYNKHIIVNIYDVNYVANFTINF